MECTEEKCGDTSPLVLRVQFSPSSSAMEVFTYTVKRPCAMLRYAGAMSFHVRCRPLCSPRAWIYRIATSLSEKKTIACFPSLYVFLRVDRCMQSLVHMSRGSCSIHAPNTKALQGALIVNSEFRAKCSVETIAPRAFQGAFV